MKSLISALVEPKAERLIDVTVRRGLRQLYTNARVQPGPPDCQANPPSRSEAFARFWFFWTEISKWVNTSIQISHNLRKLKRTVLVSFGQLNSIGFGLTTKFLCQSSPPKPWSGSFGARSAKLAKCRSQVASLVKKLYPLHLHFAYATHRLLIGTAFRKPKVPQSWTSRWNFLARFRWSLLQANWNKTKQYIAQ